MGGPGRWCILPVPQSACFRPRANGLVALSAFLFVVGGIAVLGAPLRI